MGKKLLSITFVLFVCVVGVLNFTLDEGPPGSGAIISDGTTNCGGVFLDSGFVLTTASCSRNLNFPGVNVSPARNTSIVYPTSINNPFGNFGGANGVTLIRLLCPGVTPSQVAAGTVRFAELATAAFEQNSCFTQGTLANSQTRFAGTALASSNPIISVRADPSLTLLPFELAYVGTCNNNQSEIMGSLYDDSEANASEQLQEGIFNCFVNANSTGAPLTGSPVFVLDENRFREIVIGLNVDVNGNTYAYVRVSLYITELASFLVEATTGRNLVSERITRFQRQEQIRLAIQSGQRPASLSGFSGPVSFSAAMDPQTANAVQRRHQEAFFLETFARGNWHQHSDGKSSILSIDHLQTRIDSKFKRAPASAFICPAANPGCAAV